MATRYLRRYRDGTRLNHWFVVLLFVAAAATGMALFHPALFFFSHSMGGGPWARILHPFLGLAMVAGFLWLFLVMWRENMLDANDRAWLKKADRLLAGDKSSMPDVGKYNAGQKLVFWGFAVSLLVLLVTGFMFWRPWFAHLFPIFLVRLAVLLHAVAAVVLILSVVAHVYAALWVKGTMRAMTRGTVSEGWAKLNHPLWHREMTRGK